ncbi:hypothetical protein OEV98_13580 [Caldibacillus lycopersici]|uniref:Uncharacterized protein n=1 Tax=Perspicuibacillus lycopersici TaxID=1325689 RepID=A0AAE3ITY3_9BACI|nr:hypothetical protein [Perspicuibacillus lycopersici]MCU9614570.1 hypothetical protein [Perspicuibacillus lycopersici]
MARSFSVQELSRKLYEAGLLLISAHSHKHRIAFGSMVSTEFCLSGVSRGIRDYFEAQNPIDAAHQKENEQIFS